MITQCQPTGNIPEVPELGTPHYKEQNHWSQWYVSAIEGFHYIWINLRPYFLFLIGFSPFFFPYFSSLSHHLSSLPLSPLLLLQILWKVDTILFCLLVLRRLSDSQGRVWRFHPTQLYVVEITLPEHQVCCFK